MRIVDGEPLPVMNGFALLSIGVPTDRLDPTATALIDPFEEDPRLLLVARSGELLTDPARLAVVDYELGPGQKIVIVPGLTPQVLPQETATPPAQDPVTTIAIDAASGNFTITRGTFRLIGIPGKKEPRGSLNVDGTQIEFAYGKNRAAALAQKEVFRQRRHR